MGNLPGSCSRLRHFLAWTAAPERCPFSQPFLPCPAAGPLRIRSPGPATATTGVGRAQVASATLNSHGTFPGTHPVIPAAYVHDPTALRDLPSLLCGPDFGRRPGPPWPEGLGVTASMPCAVARKVEGRSGNLGCCEKRRTYLADACEVVYTPSLSILDRCARRERRHRRDLLLVENPTADLPFTEIEGQQLRRRYPAHARLYGGGATKDRLLSGAGRCHVLNYTGHATFNPMEPLRSALVLGNKDDESQWLTLRNVFCALHLPDTWLTVINGCESGMLRPDQLDELVMLPTGFLYAGATCVLCTLTTCPAPCWWTASIGSGWATIPTIRPAAAASAPPCARPGAGCVRTSPTASTCNASCCRNCSMACATSCCGGNAKSKRRIMRRSVPAVRRSRRRYTGPLSRRLVWPIRCVPSAAPPLRE